MMGGFAAQIRSACAVAPPTLPLVATSVCLATGAQAETLADFAEQRCLAPLLAGQSADLAGLVRTSADDLGFTPEPVDGALPTYVIEANGGRYVAYREFFGLRGCLVGDRDRGGQIPMAEFEEMIEAIGFVIPETCRNLARQTDDGDPESVTIAMSDGVSPGDRLLNVARVEAVETGAIEVMIWETTVRPGGLDCGASG